jgi:hypothetical protein
MWAICWVAADAIGLVEVPTRRGLGAQKFSNRPPNEKHTSRPLVAPLARLLSVMFAIAQLEHPARRLDFVADGDLLDEIDNTPPQL